MKSNTGQKSRCEVRNQLSLCTQKQEPGEYPDLGYISVREAAPDFTTAAQLKQTNCRGDVPWPQPTWGPLLLPPLQLALRSVSCKLEMLREGQAPCQPVLAT